MSEERPAQPGSPRMGGWRPRNLMPARFRATPPAAAAPDPVVPPSVLVLATAPDPPEAPDPPTERRAPAGADLAAGEPAPASSPLLPDKEEYVPFVPSVPIRTASAASALATTDVGGDIVLTADTASTDLATSSMGRLGGRAIAMAAVVVVLGVVMSRVLGWGRTAVFAAEFGRSPDLDAFVQAFRIPDTLFQLVAAGAIGSALVPVASELIARGEDERARRLISTMVNLMVLIIAPLAAITWLLAPTLVPIVTPGFASDPHKMQTTIALTQLMLLSPILLAAGAVMAAGLNSLGLFGWSALAPNVYNIVIILAALVLTPFLGIQALAVGVILGAVGHVLTQARPFALNGLYAAAMDLHDPAVRETLLLMAPRALGLGASQIVFLVYGVFTSTGPTGDPSTFYYAFTALQIPVGLVGVPLGIVLLPPLSQAFARGQHDRFGRLVDQSLRLLLFVVVPITGLMVALAAPTIALLYRYGKLDANGAAAIVPVYLVFLVGLVAHVMIALLAPIFYAGKDTRTPVSAALVAVAVDIGAAIVLFPFMHLQGLALAIGLGAWVEVLMLLTRLEQKIGFDLRPLTRHSVSFVGGAIVASAAAFLTAKFMELHSAGTASLLGRLEMLAPAGLVGLAIYATWARLFRLPELDAALQLARTVIGRGNTAPAEPLDD
jgi:putative peptidoglycan lipid II flippase